MHYVLCVMRVYVGFITYGESTAKYLPYFLPSLKAQTFRDLKILVIDNTEEEDNENSRYLKNYPEIDFKWAGGNLGFARAYNKMINEALAGGAKYFLALNPDMLVEAEAIEKMIKAIENDATLGSISPRVLKWDFSGKKKTNIIDTCGIKILAGLRFVDAGQGKVDDGSFNNIQILGPSGAAALYRMSALEKVKMGEKEYFDDLMFMYKEDCDLAYRLHLADYKSKCAYEAIIYHDRTTSADGEGNLKTILSRKNKSRQVKKWSFLNQQIIFIKYWRRQNFWNKLAIIWWEVKIIAFAFLFEPYLLGELFKLRNFKRRIIRY